MGLPSQNVGNIDHSEVFIIVGKRRAVGMPRNGQFYSADKMNDDFEFGEGIDGEMWVQRISGDAYRIDLTLLATSRFNDYLWNLRQRVLNTPGNPPFPLAVIHKDTKLATAFCWIIKPPPITYGNGEQVRLWPFYAAGYVGKLTGITSSPDGLDLEGL